jgi:hypothetical protein
MLFGLNNVPVSAATLTRLRQYPIMVLMLLARFAWRSPFFRPTREATGPHPAPPPEPGGQAAAVLLPSGEVSAPGPELDGSGKGGWPPRKVNGRRARREPAGITRPHSGCPVLAHARRSSCRPGSGCGLPGQAEPPATAATAGARQVRRSAIRGGRTSDQARTAPA